MVSVRSPVSLGMQFLLSFVAPLPVEPTYHQESSPIGYTRAYARDTRPRRRETSLPRYQTSDSNHGMLPNAIRTSVIDSHKARASIASSSRSFQLSQFAPSHQQFSVEPPRARTSQATAPDGYSLQPSTPAGREYQYRHEYVRSFGQSPLPPDSADSSIPSSVSQRRNLRGPGQADRSQSISPSSLSQLLSRATGTHEHSRLNPIHREWQNVQLPPLRLSNHTPPSNADELSPALVPPFENLELPPLNYEGQLFQSTQRRTLRTPVTSIHQPAPRSLVQSSPVLTENAALLQREYLTHTAGPPAFTPESNTGAQHLQPPVLYSPVADLPQTHIQTDGVISVIDFSKSTSSQARPSQQPPGKRKSPESQTHLGSSASHEGRRKRSRESLQPDAGGSDIIDVGEVRSSQQPPVLSLRIPASNPQSIQSAPAAGASRPAVSQTQVGSGARRLAVQSFSSPIAGPSSTTFSGSASAEDKEREDGEGSEDAWTKDDKYAIGSAPSPASRDKRAKISVACRFCRSKFVI